MPALLVYVFSLSLCYCRDDLTISARLNGNNIAAIDSSSISTATNRGILNISYSQKMRELNVRFFEWEKRIAITRGQTLDEGENVRPLSHILTEHDYFSWMYVLLHLQDFSVDNNPAGSQRQCHVITLYRRWCYVVVYKPHVPARNPINTQLRNNVVLTSSRRRRNDVAAMLHVYILAGNAIISIIVGEKYLVRSTAFLQEKRPWYSITLRV